MTMTLQQYADARHISIQAAAASFNRHKAKMTGMYSKAGKRAPTVLNDDGIAFMDELRKKQTISVEVIDADKEKELEALREETQRLKAELAEIRQRHFDEMEKANADYRNLGAQFAELMTDYRSMTAQLIQEKDRSAELQGRLLTAAEQQTQKGFFARLFGK